MDDLRTVMDHCGSERAVVLGFSEGGPMGVQFAVEHPDRVSGLILYGSWSRSTRTDDHPYGWTTEQGRRRFVVPMRQGDVVSPRWFAPSAAGDPEFDAWFQRYARQSASPGMALALLRANVAVDVRDVLADVRAPTLVLHRNHDSLVEIGQGRYLAEHIPGAQLVEFPGSDHWPWIGDAAPVLDAIADSLGSHGD
jgi:pimeloyl-ACP methyl ester carboxylesterase